MEARKCTEQVASVFKRRRRQVRFKMKPAAAAALALLLASLGAGGQRAGEPGELGEPDAEQQAARLVVVVGSRWQQELYLPCRLPRLDAEQTVSWIRRRDSAVLSVDRLKLVDEPRLRLAPPDAHDWSLTIGQPQESDAGLYECQVPSMEPKLSRLVELRLVEAASRIGGLGANLSSLYLRPGDPLNLTCTIEAPQPTQFVYWYRNKQPVRFHSLARQGPGEEPAAGGLIVRAQRAAEPTQAPAPATAAASSSLVIAHIQANDTGNYTCLPSNAKPSQISVVVMENGVQSQPEKRSLQATDGARSWRQGRGPLGLANLLSHLIRCIWTAFFHLAPPPPLNPLPAGYTSPKQAVIINHQPETHREQLDEAKLLVRQELFAGWQELVRIIFTCLAVIYLLVGQ